MISFALPRFCDQSLDRSRKERFYPGADPWIAKLDTVVHELYHIDPELAGIRRIEREDGTYSANCHGQRFFEQVADMVHTYLNANRAPGVYDFLQHDFAALEASYGGVVGTSFRTFPSFPQRYIERLAEQPPCDADADGVKSSRCARRSSRRITRRTICTSASLPDGSTARADSQRSVQGSLRSRSSTRHSSASHESRVTIHESNPTRRAPRNRGDQ